MNGIKNPATDIDMAFFYILGVSLVLLLGITVTMIYFVVKYRRSSNPEPADIRGNWKLEVLWFTIPTLIALSMFYVGWTSYIGLKNTPPGAIEIEVIGQKFSWVFVYPNDKETENELVVPLGKPVKLKVTSLDVLHSLFIPAFRIKVDAVSGMHTYTWFYADEPGTYVILCAEYCGVAHADMTAWLRIVPEKEYLEWLEVEEDE
jgi:cytochrome c oxidase subunit 2